MVVDEPAPMMLILAVMFRSPVVSSFAPEAGMVRAYRPGGMLIVWGPAGSVVGLRDCSAQSTNAVGHAIVVCRRAHHGGWTVDSSW